MTLTIPRPRRVSTTEARETLSHLISHVQHPDAYVVLTRHGRPEAALVSMDLLGRIWNQEDIDAIIDGKRQPSFFRWGRTGCDTNREAAEVIQRTQMDRRMEREVLTRAGLKPVPGGEVQCEVSEARPRWWRRVWQRRGIART